MSAVAHGVIAVLTQERDETRAVARRCWRAWRLYAGIGSPPGTSEGEARAEALADEYPWLKEKQEED